VKADNAGSFSWKRRILFILFNLFFLVILGFLGGEIYLRIKGYKPFSNTKPDIKVEPGGKYFQKDDDLGFTHLPGKFKVTLKNEFSFVTTHRKDTFRITHPVEDDVKYKDKEKIWMVGCSVTHGWSINDHETYSWLLQEKIPQYEVINFGVSGYGTIHSLIQIKKKLKTMQKPKMIILTYGTFHDNRNTFSPLRRRVVARWNFLGPMTQPYAMWDMKGKLVIHKAKNVIYKPWFLSDYSALVNYFEKKHIAYKSGKIPHHLVTRLLIRKIFGVCKREGIRLVVIGIKENATKGMADILKYCGQYNIPNVDISVDLGRKEHNNLPYDAHPSALANKKYARRLLEFLKQKDFLNP